MRSEKNTSESLAAVTVSALAFRTSEIHMVGDSVHGLSVVGFFWLYVYGTESSDIE